MQFIDLNDEDHDGDQDKIIKDHDGDQGKIIAQKPLTFILNLKIVMGSKKKEAKVKIIFSLISKYHKI